jgi:hypothetical protein
VRDLIDDVLAQISMVFKLRLRIIFLLGVNIFRLAVTSVNFIYRECIIQEQTRNDEQRHVYGVNGNPKCKNECVSFLNAHLQVYNQK